MKKRNLCYSAALLFFIWENVAMVRWATRFDSIGTALNHTYHAMTEDWMTMLVLQDGGVFAVLVIAWQTRGLAG